MESSIPQYAGQEIGIIVGISVTPREVVILSVAALESMEYECPVVLRDTCDL